MTTEYTTQLTTFAADLTDAAYAAVLRHGVGGSWIDLQLDVWRALAETIRETEQQSPPSKSSVEIEEQREAFLFRATEAAYRSVLRHDVHGSFLDIELDLHLALRRVMERPEAQAMIGTLFGPGARVVADAVLSRSEGKTDRADRECYCHTARN